MAHVTGEGAPHQFIKLATGYADHKPEAAWGLRAVKPSRLTPGRPAQLNGY